MAPEQARGEVDRLDKRCDVFALGSILAEILTGQPAFTGRSGGEILRKSARGDLGEAFARLDQSGADAALVELSKAGLAGEPEDRPANAQEVADALLDQINSVYRRLREAELAQAAEHARAEEAKRTALAESARAEEARRAAESAEARPVAERRARRLQVGLAASLVGLMALGGGGYALRERGRAEWSARTARAVEDALADAARLEGEARSAPPGETAGWALAISAVKRAEGLLAQGEADASLSGRVAAQLDRLDRRRAAAGEKARQLEADRDLLADLELVRGNWVDHLDPKRTDAEYAAVFRKVGLDLDATSPAESGRWLAGRSEPLELAGYLDDWIIVRRRAGRAEADWRRLVTAVRAADHDPWRDALRARIGTIDAGAVAEFRRLADDEKALDVQPAPSLILLARQLKNDVGDPERAARVLRRAAARYPADFEAHFALALAQPATSYTAIGQFPRPEEAVRHLTAAVALRPGNSFAHSALGSALSAQGKLDEDIAEQREAIRLKPDNAIAHNNLGDALENQGRLEEAATEYREAIRLKPNFLQFQGLGNALMAAKKPAEAEAAYREAIRLKPDYIAAHRGLGNALKARGNPDETATEYREAIRLKPDDPLAHVLLAGILKASKKYEEAVAQYREAIRLKPDMLLAHVELGHALKDHGKLDEAVAQYREAIRLKPDDAGVHLDLGMTQYLRQDMKAAVISLRAATRLRPDDYYAHDWLGFVLNSLKEWDEAIVEFRRAIDLRPTYVEAHVNLGNALKGQGKLDEAVAQYREAIRLGLENVETSIMLAGLVEAKEGLKPALEILREVIRRNPGSARAHDHLGYVLQRWGRPEEALPLYLEAIRLEADGPRTNAQANLAGLLPNFESLAMALRTAREWVRLKPGDPLARQALDRLLKKEVGRLDAVFPPDPFAR